MSNLNFEKVLAGIGQQERTTKEVISEDGKIFQKVIPISQIQELYTTPRKGKSVLVWNGKRLFKHPDSLHVTSVDEIGEVYAVGVVDIAIPDDEIKEEDISLLYKVTKKKANSWAW